MVESVSQKEKKVFKPSFSLVVVILIVLGFIFLPGLWKAVLFMVAFTGLILFFLFFQIKVIRLLQNMPRSTIRAAAIGMVELGGKLYSQKEVIAPLSGKKCAYYEVNISSDPLLNKKMGSAGTPYHTTKSKEELELVDETGRIKLNLFSLGFDAEPIFYESLANADVLTGPVRKYLTDNNIDLDKLYRANSGKNRTRNYQIKIVEKVIEYGSQVYVVGNAQVNPAGKLELMFKYMYPYLISYRDENNLIKAYRKSNIVLSIVSLFNITITTILVLNAI